MSSSGVVIDGRVAKALEGKHYDCVVIGAGLGTVPEYLVERWL